MTKIKKRILSISIALVMVVIGVWTGNMIVKAEKTNETDSNQVVEELSGVIDNDDLDESKFLKDFNPGLSKFDDSNIRKKSNDN